MININICSGVYTGGVRGQNPPEAGPIYLSILKLSKQQKLKIQFGVGKIWVNSPVKLDQFSTNKNINRQRSEFWYTCSFGLPIEHTKRPRQNLLRSSRNLEKKVYFFSFLPISRSVTETDTKKLLR